VEDNSEAECRLEPMLIDLPIRVHALLSAVDGAIEDYHAMVDGEDDPSPEDPDGEVLALLAGFEQHWESVDDLIISILLKEVAEETMEAGPKEVVQHGKPVYPEDLS